MPNGCRVDWIDCFMAGLVSAMIVSQAFVATDGPVELGQNGSCHRVLPASSCASDGREILR
jgi:hypothetical protein